MAKTKSNLGKSVKKAQDYFKKSNLNLLHNKYLLYFILILSICDLLLFAYLGELVHVIIYILVGVITSFFTKNMIVILTVAMVVTNLIRYGRNINNKEGFEDEAEEIIKEQVGNLGEKEREYMLAIRKGDKEPLKNLSEQEQMVFEKMTDYIENDNKVEDDEEDEEKKDKEEDNEEGFKGKEGMKNKSGFKGKQGMKNKQNMKNIEAASTSSVTKNPLQQEAMQVIKQQRNLIEKMNKLEPMLTQAEKFMEQFKKTQNKENMKNDKK